MRAFRYYARMGMGNPEAKLQLGPAQTSNDSGQNANLSQTLGEAWRTCFPILIIIFAS